MSLKVVIVLHPLSVSRNSGILVAFGTWLSTREDVLSEENKWTFLLEFSPYAQGLWIGIIQILHKINLA
jgi:hypothetical protein